MPLGGAIYRSANLPTDNITQAAAAGMLNVSDREIARRCGVQHQLVAILRNERRELSLDESSSDIPQERQYTDRWGNTSVMDIANYRKPSGKQKLNWIV